MQSRIAVRTTLVLVYVVAALIAIALAVPALALECMLAPGTSCIITMPAGVTPPPTPIPPPTPVPPTPPPLPANCKKLTMNWAQPQRLFTASVGGFGSSEIIAVEFTTGAFGTAQSLPRFAAAEYQDAPSSRYAVISDLPCDFTMAAKNLYSGPSNSVTVAFAILPGTNAFYGSLQQNRTYHFNIRNEGGSGNMFVDLIKGGVSRATSAKPKPKPVPK